MTSFNEIISTFSTEEQQQFISYLEKKNKRRDTKNITLFKLYVKNENDSKRICTKLYGRYNKVAYHALRKRLYQSMIDFIANINLEEENSVDMQIIKYILASRTFLSHQHYKVAYKILDKAETLAEEHHLFAILNEIYHTQIQYAYAFPTIDLDSLIDKFKKNQAHRDLEDQLNIVYAKMRHTLNSMTHQGEIVDFETLLRERLEAHHISYNNSMSFKSLYQLMRLISISAFVTNDYLKIEPFLIQTYKQLEDHKSKTKQLFYHIQVLYLIANTLFRNKKFEASQSYLELMQQLMLERRAKYKKSFYLKYKLLLGLNYNYSNQQALAISTLEPLIGMKHEDIESVLDIQLSLTMIYIQAEAYKKAQQLFNTFYHTDKYYESKVGKEWVIKKNLIEIILYIELGHIDLVDSRLLSFKRQYYNHLKNINQQRVIHYLSFVEHYYKKPEEVRSPSFFDMVESAFEWISADEEDIFVMSYYAWLKSKMENKTLYSITLELVEQAQAVK